MELGRESVCVRGELLMMCVCVSGGGEGGGGEAVKLESSCVGGEGGGAEMEVERVHVFE